jgi:hypothetical protein
MFSFPTNRKGEAKRRHLFFAIKIFISNVNLENLMVFNQAHAGIDAKRCYTDQSNLKPRGPYN